MLKITILFITFILISFTGCKDYQCQDKTYRCDRIVNDSLVELKGVIYVSTKDTIIFHKSDFIQKNRYGKKMHLIPCDENLKNYLFKEYDIFLYLKNHNDNFWVSIEGGYLASDTLRQPQQFLLKSISILDSEQNNKDNTETKFEQILFENVSYKLEGDDCPVLK